MSRLALSSDVSCESGGVPTRFQSVRPIDLRMRYSNLKNSLQFSKIETIFQKLNNNFRSNEKYFSVDYYFTLHQTPKK
jgi:hypothetical protein